MCLVHDAYDDFTPGNQKIVQDVDVGRGYVGVDANNYVVEN